MNILRKFLFFFLLFLFSRASGQFASPKSALLLIDIQDFYFDPSKSPLEGNIEASEKARQLLDYFRKSSRLVVHVEHKGGGDIHPNVAPLPGEKVFEKEQVSCFVGTGLLDFLQDKGINQVVIAGMMTHMCVEAAVRSAADLGFDVILISDACATKDLKYGEEIIQAKAVHLSTLSTLGAYAGILTTGEYLAEGK